MSDERSRNPQLRALVDALVTATGARRTQYGDVGHVGALAAWHIPCPKKKANQNRPLIAEYPGYLVFVGLAYNVALYAQPDDDWRFHIQFLPDDDVLRDLLGTVGSPWNDAAIVRAWAEAERAHVAKWHAHPSKGYSRQSGKAKHTAASEYARKKVNAEKYVPFARKP